VATVDAFEFDREGLNGLIELVGEGIEGGGLRGAQSVTEAIEATTESKGVPTGERVIQGRQSGRGETLGEADVVGVVVGP